MAHVVVDRETGVVKMKKFVAVQDMGLIINRKTAESQVSRRHDHGYRLRLV